MADWDAPLQPIGQPSTFPGTIPPPPLPSGQSAAPTGQSVGTPIGRDVIVGFWKGKGVPDYVAEGIADATHDESGIRGNPNLFNPAAVNPESGAIGLHQDLGERKDKLQAQPDWQDPKVQLEHAYGEVTGGDADASKHWNEIKNAKTREEAAALFKHYFERPGAAGGDKLAASWDAEPLKVSAPGWNVSPDAIAADQASGADVRYMSPADYLAMAPPIAEGAGQSAKARSLAKSLAAGDNIESIPSLDVKPQAGKLVVYDQDGRNRALAAQEAGVDLIPVAINGVPKTGAPEQIQGMTGTTRPFDWKPVGKVEQTETQAPDIPERFNPYVAAKNALGRIDRTVTGWALGAIPIEPGSPEDQRMTAEDAARAAQPQPPQAYTDTVLPLKVSAAGDLSPAVPTMISGPLQSIAEMGQRAVGAGETGQNPLRALTPDQIATVAGFAGTPLAGMRDLGMAPETTAAALGRPNPLTDVFPARPASPPPISPERAALAREAIDDFGIPLRVTQVGMNPTQKYAESAIRRLPFSGAGIEDQQVRQAFTRAVSKTFGEDADALTQTVMDRAKRRIGGVINRIEDTNKIRLDDRTVGKLAEIEDGAAATLPPEQFGIIRRRLNDIIAHVTENKIDFDKLRASQEPIGKWQHLDQSGDVISGETYGALFRRGSPLDRAIASPGNVGYYAGQIKAVLQDALQRSLSGDDLAAYKNARFEYKNMKTVEPLINKSPTGEVSPALLNSRVSQQFPNRAYDTSGTNPLDRLAKIGQAFLKEPGSSGTSERGMAQYGLAKAGEMVAGVVAGNFLGIPMALAGGAAALAGGRAIGSYLRSPALVDRLLSRVLDGNVSGGRDLMAFASQLPATRGLLAKAAMPTPAPYAVGGALSAAMLRNPPASGLGQGP